MKKILPYLMALMLLAAAVAGMLLLGRTDKKKDTGFEGARFVLREDVTRNAAKFLSDSRFV